MVKYPLYIALPGMEVYLAENFFKSLTDRPPRLHSHPAYELVCIETVDGMDFRIIPPLQEHLAAEGTLTSLLFSYTQEAEADICQALKATGTQLRISDDFEGSARIRSAKQLAENILQPGAREQLAAELRLLFVCLARKANVGHTVTASHQQTLDEERLAILEDYFNIGLKDPDCSKSQLATLLGVGERQLTRILSEVYHSSFSEILLRSRMNIAQAMVMEGRKSVEQIAEAVGYRSAEALKRAYRSYFGESMKTK